MLTRAMRWTYAGMAWLLLAAILLQVFFAGLGVFAGVFRLHALGAAVIGVLVLLLVPVAFAARLPTRAKVVVGVLFVDMVLQGLLVDQWRAGGPALVAALHPVNALALFALAGYIATRSRAFVPGRRATRPAVVDQKAAAAA
jgi:hypothetical protein